MAEKWISGTGQTLHVHDEESCSGHCAIHSPSEHSMRDFPTHYRWDRGIMERICPHGVGHPDPDDMEYQINIRGVPEHVAGTHGCCGQGCCTKGTDNG